MSSAVRVRPYPVLIACEGCPAHGQGARELGTLLDRQGFGEAAWLGAARELPTIRAKARARFPVFALEGCEKRCARAWLAAQGVEAQRCIVLRGAGDDCIALAAAHLAAE